MPYTDISVGNVKVLKRVTLNIRVKEKVHTIAYLVHSDGATERDFSIKDAFIDILSPVVIQSIEKYVESLNVNEAMADAYAILKSFPNLTPAQTDVIKTSIDSMMGNIINQLQTDLENVKILLREHDKLLKLIPDCEHGWDCIPCGIKWIKQRLLELENPLVAISFENSQPVMEFYEAVQTVMDLQARYYKGEKDLLDDCKAAEAIVRKMLKDRNEGQGRML